MAYFLIPQGAPVHFVTNSGCTDTRHFTAHHHDTDKLGLVALLESFANDQWIGEHYTEEQACEAAMDRFRRLVLKELELVELRVCHDVEQ